MRIAVLGQSYPPMISGAALFSCHLAEALAERGHTVLVLAASDRGKPYWQQRGTLSILRLQSLRNPNRVGQRFLLWPANEIRAALRGFRPDVIHLHDPFQLAYFAHRYAQSAGIPCTVTIHALPTLVSALAGGVPGIQSTIEKGLWEYANWLIHYFDSCVTPTTTISRTIAERTGVQPQVISGGVNLQTFCSNPLPRQSAASLRTELGIPTDAQVILHVGRLDGDKNIRMVIQAAALTIHSLPSKPVHLLVVGDGCEKSRLLREAEGLGIGPCCHFPGYISDPGRLSAIYRMADLFVMASEIETQGLVLLEAAACGLPIVAVNATAVPEIVTDGVNGFLVPAGDARVMAHRILAILENPDMARRMGRASRQASLAHDFNRTVDDYEAFYLSAIQEQAMFQRRGTGKNKLFTRVGSDLPGIKHP